MGAADVVPGVSGGTIAFISGIYEKLIESIKSVNGEAIKLLLKFKIADLWKHVNGNFLLVLFLGIGTAVISLAKLLNYILETHPVLVWSFFFGLIVASAIYVAKTMKKKGIPQIIGGILGIAAAVIITSTTPAETTTAPWFIFLSGSIAICAMILPGISGSFILLLLGKYEYILGAISEFKISVILIFAAGAGVGIIAFSNVLSWLLKKYHDITIAVLAGFMIGSLNKVWPWKKTVETFVDRHGEIQPLIQKNVLPQTYTELSGNDNFLLYASLLAILGFSLIFIIEKIADTAKK